jgi:hypothetical protein
MEMERFRPSSVILNVVGDHHSMGPVASPVAAVVLQASFVAAVSCTKLEDA